MDDFTPEKFYHPEDEYESLETEQEQFEAERAEALKETEPEKPAMDTVPPADEPVSAEEQPSDSAEKPKPEPAEEPKAESVEETAAPRQPENKKQQTPPSKDAQQAAYPFTVPPYAYYPYQQMTGYPQPMQQPVQYYYPNMGYQQTPPGYPQNLPRPEQSVQTVQPYAPMPSRTPENAYTQPSQPAQKPPKQPTPLGTKVFIIILCALLLAMVLGFVAYIATSQREKGGPEKQPGYSFSFGDDDDSGSGNNGDGNSDGGDENGLNPFSFNNNSGSYSDVEDTITLIADNGETVKRDNDNPDSVGDPDPDAKNIALENPPKDQDSAKHNTQSAYAAVSDSVVTVVCYEDTITDDTNDIISQGSGVIFSTDGYLITNAHVIGNSRAYAVNIVLNSGEKYQAKIIGFDTWTDLAVLKIDAKDLKAVTFGDSEKINIGDDVIAVGSPGGEQFQNSLTKGVISALDRELSVNKNVKYIQSDAAISPGSSGGPLCNLYGQVIGITTAKAVAENFESMSFSIPSATVERIVGDLLHYGFVQGRTRIGFSGKELSASDASYYNVSGVVVGTIDDDGSLADSDIKEGDIITELDGQTITSFQDIYDVLDDHKPGDEITIKAKRPSSN